MTDINKNPYISLVVLTYNRTEGLTRCLDSISKMRTDRISYEVVVVDDGSSVDNESVVNNFRNSLPVRYIKKKHGGVASARNFGIRKSNGELVAFIADDYILPRNYLVDIMNFFESSHDAYVITHNIKASGPSIFRYVQRLYFELTLLQRFKAEELKSDVVKSYELPPSRAAAFKREIFDLVGYFNEEFLTGEDGEFGMRMASKHIPVYFFPHKHIEHWENKSNSGYLEQRIRYGRSYFRAINTNSSHSNKTPTFGKITEIISKQYLAWLKLCYRLGRLTEYLMLSPLIVLFLAFYYSGVYMESKSEVYSYGVEESGTR